MGRVAELGSLCVECMNVLRDTSGAPTEVDRISLSRRCPKECFGLFRFDVGDVIRRIIRIRPWQGRTRTFGWSAFALLGRAEATHNQTLEPTGMSAPDLPLRPQVVGHHRLPVAQLFR